MNTHDPAPDGRPTPTELVGRDSGRWPPALTEVLGGDLVAALAYRTPAGGTVVVPVTTFGMYDASAGTVTFTSSFGAGKKLQRIAADSRVALAYHTREHGDATTPSYVLVQGDASFPDRPDPDFLDRLHEQRWARFAPVRPRGRLWDWLTREYHDHRVPVTVDIHRISVWPGLDADGQPSTVVGHPAPATRPDPQDPPRNGTDPRVRASKYRKRLARTRHSLIGYNDADGYPIVRPVGLTLEGDHLHVSVSGSLPAHRRAGLLAHWFEDRMIPQGSVVLTGWLADDRAYSPHTLAGYEMPVDSELAYELASALTAKFGHRRATKEGTIKDGVWQG